MDTLPAPSGCLDASAAAHPQRTALIGSRGRLSYRELQTRALGIAQRLHQASVGHGSVLAVLSTDPWLIALLSHAAALAGCALAPLNPALPATHLAALLRDCRATHAVADFGTAPLPAGLQRLPPGWILEAPPNDGLSGAPALSLDDVHLIIATSGSSATPRGVMLSGRNLAAAVQASRERLPLDPEDLWLDCLPLFHIGGLAILQRCTEAGAAVLLQPRFDAYAVRAAIAAQGVTHLSLVAPMLARLLGVPDDWRPPPSLRCALLGGGPLSTGLAQQALRAGWPLWVSYGMTEAASQVATLGPITVDWVAGQVGRPLTHIEPKVSPSPGPGRICIRGPGLMLGYANPAGELRVGLQDGWLETGDIGTLSPDGTLQVHGRADAVVVTGGVNVAPAQVEDLLAHCSQVGDVGVTSIPDPVWGARLVAVVTGAVDLAVLDSWCRATLPGPMRPRLLLRAAALPRTPLGKLERAALVELALQRMSEATRSERFSENL